MSFDINHLTLMHNIATNNFTQGVLNFVIYFFVSFSKLFGQKIDTERHKLDKNNACVHLYQFLETASYFFNISIDNVYQTLFMLYIGFTS